MNPKKALMKAQNICMRQEKCVSEMKQKMYEWKVHPDHMNSIIDSLVEQKFIDEKRYVESFVREKIHINKWGKIKIRYALLQKQVNESLVSDELEKVDENAYKTMMKNQIIKKINSLGTLDFYELKNKLLRFGSSRGYELEYLHTIIEEFKN